MVLSTNACITHTTHQESTSDVPTGAARTAKRGLYHDNSDNINHCGADRASRVDVRTPLRKLSPVRRPQSRGCSPDRARRGYAGGRYGGGSAPGQDDIICLRYAGESLDGSFEESCSVNGKGDGVSPERVF